MTIKNQRNEITLLIDNIKEHSDRLKDYENLPLLELSVILSKITKLHENTLILKYTAAKEQNYLEEEFGATLEYETEPKAVKKEKEVKSSELDVSAATLVDQAEQENNEDSMHLMADVTLSVDDEPKVETQNDVLEKAEPKTNLEPISPQGEKKVDEPDESSDDSKTENEELTQDENKHELNETSVETEEEVEEKESETESLEDHVAEEKQVEEIKGSNAPKEEALKAIKEEMMSAVETEKAEEFIGQAEIKTEVSAKPDINEAFTNTEDGSLSGHLQKKPIADLISAIGLNERYLYANDLFEGDMDEFKNSINALNDSENREVAIQYFDVKLSEKYHWKQNDPLVKALRNLVLRRFL
jgi:hypothetical protein